MPNLIQKQNHQESCSFYGEKCACSGSVKLKALERAFCPAPHHMHLASSATGWELTNSLHGLILQTCTPAKRGLLMETLCLHSPERAAREEPAPRAALGTWLAPSEPSAWHRPEGSSSTASHRAWPRVRDLTCSEGHPLATLEATLTCFLTTQVSKSLLETKWLQAALNRLQRLPRSFTKSSLPSHSSLCYQS